MRPQMGQPQMGQPQMGQPQMGQPQMGQAQMMQAQMAQSQIPQLAQILRLVQSQQVPTGWQQTYRLESRAKLIHQM